MICLPPINNKLIQLIIVVSLLILMGVAIVLDGELGERVFTVLIATFGVVMGYFFRKAVTNKS